MDFLHPENWPRAPGFSWGVAAEGRLVFAAGQIGRDPVTGAYVKNDFGAQASQALANLVTVLKEAGTKPEHIAHMTWYVTDIEAYKAAGRDIGAGYKAHIGKHFPSMTMVQIGALLDADALVEIECFAVAPSAA
jgi:enamine deaminase RidA (YjgF/YER057c/UK114 family)